MDKASGEPVKRTTLLQELSLSDNSPTRNMITNSNKYGITTGSFAAEKLSLTVKGKAAVDANAPDTQRRARFDLAIQGVEPFNKLYDTYKGNKLPSAKVMQDVLDQDVDPADRAPCVDIFIQNAKFVGLLKTSEGAEVLGKFGDRISENAESGLDNASAAASSAEAEANKPASEAEDFDCVCFFIAPIGSAGDEQRQHSDAVLASYVEKALESVTPKLKVVRADKIDHPGMISGQVIEYILKSRLVVADLSYLNPNVFYELCLRHATGKPVIHIKRDGDKIPFDNNNFRTIDINFSDKFKMLAELETVRSTIATYARQALSAGESADNPILAYCPDHRFEKKGNRG